MKDKDIIKLYNNMNNKYSNILFNKDYNLLQIGEIQKVDEYIKDINNPIWKKVLIRGEDSIYEVSNIGEVRNSLYYNILAQSKSKTGYMHIDLRRIESGYSKTYTFLTHRLVAEAFIPNPENKPQVNHINGIKDCNWVGNLEWVTPKENSKHAWETGLSYSLKGSDNPLSKYTEEQIHEVCKLLEKGMLQKEISKITNITESTINMIQIGRRWKHISSKYKIKHNQKPRRSSDENKIIDEFIRNKYSDREIFKLIYKEKDNKNLSFIKFRRNKLEQTSSTIENVNK